MNEGQNPSLFQLTRSASRDTSPYSQKSTETRSVAVAMAAYRVSLTPRLQGEVVLLLVGSKCVGTP